MKTKHICADGAQYERLDNGVIYHTNWRDMPRREYNQEYLDKYREIEEASRRMAWLRAGLVLPHLAGNEVVYEMGYGLGHFVEAIHSLGFMISGQDAAPQKHLQELVFYLERPMFYEDTLCMFDVLEHFEDLSILTNCKRLVYLSVPEAPSDWNEFETWRHRRPDEHIMHFSKSAMVAALDECGFNRILFMGNPEDALRKGENGKPNILTVIASR